jgi:hypothetical protein
VTKYSFLYFVILSEAKNLSKRRSFVISLLRMTAVTFHFALLTFNLFRNKTQLFLLGIFLLGAVLRLYNLNWGSPFYFHPDERNIAGSISRMYFEKTLNPHFFAYGSFWSYIVLFLINATDFLYKITNPQILEFVKNTLPQDPFSRAIILLRIFSALQGIGTIVISYFVGKKIVLISKFKFQSSKIVLLLPFLVATSPGLIQASHFGTFESSLTFLYFLIFYLCIKTNIKYYFLAVIIFGIAVSIKVTSLILFPVLLFSLLLINKKSPISPKSLICLIFLIFVPIAIFILSNPFSINWSFSSNEAMKQWFLSPFSSDFVSSMNYESAVARGTMNVFYTQQFQQTTPIVYQFIKVLPYVLNPMIYLLFIFSLLYFVSVIARREWNERRGNLSKKIASLIAFARNDKTELLFAIVFFLLIFIPNSILYVKWTRYIIPSLPYIYIFVFLFLIRFTRLSLIIPISLITLVLAVFFTTVYSFDTRIEAAKWAKQNLNQQDAKIISEVYDMGIVPFNEVIHYSQIRLFNFYDLDDKNLDEAELSQLQQMIEEANVVILPSHRIEDTRLRLKNLYPNGYWFYDALTRNQLEFRPKASFSHPYDNIIPGLTPDESFTVFDHPNVKIYSK